MGFFKSITHAIGNVISNAVKNPIATIADIAAIATGQPEIAAIGNAANTASKGGSLTQSLLSGATAYAGQVAGQAIGEYASTSSIGKAIGLDTPVSSLISDSTTVGPRFLDTGLSDVVGSRLNGQIGATLANSTIGNAVGGAATALLSPSQAKSGSDFNIGDQTISGAQTNTGTGVTSVTPTNGDAAPSGDDVARAAAAAAGRNQSILSDQSDSDTVNGNPNILRRKSLLSD